MSDKPLLAFGREVFANAFGANAGPTGVNGGNGDGLYNLGVINFRPVRHYIETSFVAAGGNASSTFVLQMMLFDQTGHAGTTADPGSQQCVCWFFQSRDNSGFVSLVRGLGTFTPVAGPRSMMLRWASNGGGSGWVLYNGTYMNGVLRIYEAPQERQLGLGIAN